MARWYTETDQIWCLARTFYRSRGHRPPRDFGPRHRSWRFFRQALLWMLGLGTLYKGKYRTYIAAQFHYAPARDKLRVWPNMLASHRATENWKKYLAWKTRRVGERIPGLLNYEKGLSRNRMIAVFDKGAWDLEGFLRDGFTIDEAFRAFCPLFDPVFILASPGVFGLLEENPARYGPEVQAAYRRMLKKPDKTLNRMRCLYSECRERQHRRWESGFVL